MDLPLLGHMSQKNWIVLLASILGVIVIGGGAWALFNAGKNSATTSSSSSTSVSSFSSSSSKTSSSSSSSSSSISSSAASSSSTASSSTQSSQASSSSAQATAQKYSDPELPGFSISLVDGWQFNSKTAVVEGGSTEYSFKRGGELVTVRFGESDYFDGEAKKECVSIGNTWNRCSTTLHTSAGTDEARRVYLLDEIAYSSNSQHASPIMEFADIKNVLVKKYSNIRVQYEKFADRAGADSFIKTMQF